MINLIDKNIPTAIIIEKIRMIMHHRSYQNRAVGYKNRAISQKIGIGKLPFFQNIKIMPQLS